MNQESTTIEVTPVDNGVYRLFSKFDKDSIALTTQGLLELAIWIEANREALVTEAKHEAAQRPAGANTRTQQREVAKALQINTTTTNKWMNKVRQIMV